MASPKEVAAAFVRSGSTSFKNASEEALRMFLSSGLTGETFYQFDSANAKRDPICVIHFNDVYNVETPPRGPGGMARFINAMRVYADQNPLVLFSGDVLNPSVISGTTKGRHMVPFLNMLKVHTACFGNHEFDFGLDHLEYLSGSTQFPWVLSNVFDADSPQRPLAGSLYRLFEFQGHRVGIMGLVEREWLATLATIEESDVIFQDFVEAADEMSRALREKECSLIIALTHMRAPNDERLAREAEDIDIILGGHDHDYFGLWQPEGRVPIVKSGTDFRDFTFIKIYPGKNPLLEDEEEAPRMEPQMPAEGEEAGGTAILPRFCGGSVLEWHRVEVSEELPVNRHVDAMVNKYLKELGKDLDHTLGETAVPLDTRFSVIRTQECNAGNWLTDLMRLSMRTRIAVLNSGTARSDCIFPKGPFRIRDLMMMLPMMDELAVVEITGNTILEVLENSVSMWPKTEGRFLQVSGLQFTFDGEGEPGSRIRPPVFVNSRGSKHNWEPLGMDDMYTVCLKQFMLDGKDGFTMLQDCEVKVDSEQCQNLTTMIRNCFSFQALANGFHKPRTQPSVRRLQSLRALDTAAIEQLHGMRRESIDGKQVFRICCAVEGRIKRVGGDESQKAAA